MKKKELKAENKRLTILVDRLNIRVEELRKANDMVASRNDCYLQKLFQLLSELESSRNGAQVSHDVHEPRVSPPYDHIFSS